MVRQRRITEWLCSVARRGNAVSVVAEIYVNGKKVHASPTLDLLQDLAKSWAGQSGLTVLDKVELLEASQSSERILGSTSLASGDWSEYDEGSKYGYKAVKSVTITSGGNLNAVRLLGGSKIYFSGSVTEREVHENDTVKIEIRLTAQQTSLSCCGLTSGNSCSGGAVPAFLRACIGKIVGKVNATMKLDKLRLVFSDDSTTDVSTSSSYSSSDPEAFTVVGTYTQSSAFELKKIIFLNSSSPSIDVEIAFQNNESFDGGVSHTFKLRVEFSS